VERTATHEESVAEVKQHIEPEPSVPDPGWILDSLMDEKPVEPLKFQRGVKENRIILLGSMALVALARLLVEISVSELLVIVTGVVGLNLLLCFIRYKDDPSQAEFDTFKKETSSRTPNDCGFAFSRTAHLPNETHRSRGRLRGAKKLSDCLAANEFEFRPA
jgi:hypothetical protein